MTEPTDNLRVYTDYMELLVPLIVECANQVQLDEITPEILIAAFSDDINPKIIDLADGLATRVLEAYNFIVDNTTGDEA